MRSKLPQYAVTIAFDRSWDSGRFDIEVGDKIVGQRTALRMSWGPDEGPVAEHVVDAVLVFVKELWMNHLVELDMGSQRAMF